MNFCWHQWNTDWQHCDVSCEVLFNMLSTENDINVHFLSYWWRNRFVSDRGLYRNIFAIIIFRAHGWLNISDLFSTEKMGEDLAKYVTELAIRVWLIQILQILKFLRFFNRILLKLLTDLFLSLILSLVLLKPTQYQGVLSLLCFRVWDTLTFLGRLLYWYFCQAIR